MTSASVEAATEARQARGADPRLADLIATEIPGLSIATGAFDAIVAGLRASLLRLAEPDAPRPLAVPPVISRSLLERVGYVDTFPNLLGTVHSFTGTSHRWRALQQQRDEGTSEWHVDQQISDVAVLPATCYHVYPLFEGERLGGPVVLTAEAHCYRHEGTHERGRLRSFRMREFVRISTADDCLEWRDAWVERARTWLGSLGLDVSVEPASDPFFGGAGRLMSATQREQQLKWELTVAVGDGLSQAVASANCHKDHFGQPFDIEVDGFVAHTACAAFGLERITLALTAAHGANTDRWPAEVRSALGLAAAE